jgi:UDP-N-acetylglucosamine diphosphorylase/glucosamine-1-phosphate N-acetyltransferase
MNVILFDEHPESFYPLSLTRPISELRVGISLIREKWQYWIPGSYSYACEAHLAGKYHTVLEERNLWINSRVLPNVKVVEAIRNLALNEALFHDSQLIACANASGSPEHYNKVIQLVGELDILEMHTDLFHRNGAVMVQDFKCLTEGRKSEPIPEWCTVLGTHEVFVEPGAQVFPCILNATNGPIYIGKDAIIMENAVLKGPLALNEAATIKVGAKIYGDTTIGPHCKIGGEVSNTVFWGYSNKGHDGFLGNSAVGAWCNLGADTNSSNLKNNYAPVKLWDYATGRFKDTGLQFCGLVMGDHSKCGINTMFNTGTVIGVSANIFGSGFPRNFIPSFSWGGANGFSTYQLKKAFETAQIMMARRQIFLDDKEKDILEKVFDKTKTYRIWDNKK